MNKKEKSDFFFFFSKSFVEMSPFVWILPAAKHWWVFRYVIHILLQVRWLCMRLVWTRVSLRVQISYPGLRMKYRRCCRNTSFRLLIRTFGTREASGPLGNEGPHRFVGNWAARVECRWNAGWSEGSAWPISWQLHLCQANSRWGRGLEGPKSIGESCRKVCRAAMPNFGE